MKKILNKVFVWMIGLSILPSVTLASGKTLASLINLIIGYLNVILVLLMGFAVVVFVYYVIKYYIMPNENRAEAGYYVMYSIIGFFVILSFWGLVNILQNTFSLKNEDNRPSSWASLNSLFPSSGSSNSSYNALDSVIGPDSQ